MIWSNKMLPPELSVLYESIIQKWLDFVSFSLNKLNVKMRYLQDYSVENWEDFVKLDIIDSDRQINSLTYDYKETGISFCVYTLVLCLYLAQIIVFVNHCMLNHLMIFSIIVQFIYFFIILVLLIAKPAASNNISCSPN